MLTSGKCRSEGDGNKRELVRQQNMPQAKQAGRSGGKLACLAALPAGYSSNQNSKLECYDSIGVK